MKKVTLKIILGTIIFEAILICMLILLGDNSYVLLKTMRSGLCIFYFSLPCLFYSKIYNNYRKIALSGAVCAGLKSMISILTVWGLIGNSIFLEKLEFTCGMLSWSLAYISLILSFYSTDGLMNKFKNVSMISASILTIVSIFLSWTEISLPESLFRFLLILLIIAICSFLGTLILRAIKKNDNKEKMKYQDQQNIMDNQQIGANITFQSTIQQEHQFQSNQEKVKEVINQTELNDGKYKKIEQIKSLLDNNAITQEEYEIEKSKILNS